MDDHNRRFGEVRSALAMAPGPLRWRALESLALAWPAEQFLDTLWPYLDGAFVPEDGPREADERVIAAIRSGQPPAHLLLYDTLNLSDRRQLVTNRAVVQLARSPYAASLHDINLSGAPIGDEAFEALAAGASLGALRRLDLSHTTPRVAGLRALGRSATLASLSSLRLNRIGLDDTGFAALVSAGGLPALTELVACHGLLTDLAVDVLIASGRLARLEAIELIGHGVTNAGARQLAPHLHNLRRLYLDHNDIGRDGLNALYDAPSRRRGADISCYPADHQVY